MANKARHLTAASPPRPTRQEMAGSGYGTGLGAMVALSLTASSTRGTWLFLATSLKTLKMQKPPPRGSEEWLTEFAHHPLSYLDSLGSRSGASRAEGGYWKGADIGTSRTIRHHQGPTGQSQTPSPPRKSWTMPPLSQKSSSTGDNGAFSQSGAER
ncbi:hypothetical protein BaRGS_00020074 [Batillaria attramentaria]|uniref:Uncharacterized protein n=1 Tax=Batillaria attramentaria TaxID=370345 RepID=A0ABD0KN01_9CAEN